jgi:Tol biopolymer transport system component
MGLVAALVLALQAQNPPSQAPAATDVFVASLSGGGGTFTLGAPENISKSPGYDNQPSFSPDGTTLFFTSDRGPHAGLPNQGADAQALMRTDIFSWDARSRRISRVTATPEGEYSPTVMPDGRHLSAIRVEADRTQRLWKFGLDGSDPTVVLPDVKPVGYHAWLDENTLVLFVLGQPASLQVADVRTGKTETLATDIGQSIQKIPAGGVSYVQQSGEGSERTLTIMEVRREGGKLVTRPLTPVVEGARQAHVAWTPDGTLLMANGATLHAWKRGQTAWRAVADLAKLELRNVTRLAVSPKGDLVALVAVP